MQKKTKHRKNSSSSSFSYTKMPPEQNLSENASVKSVTLIRKVFRCLDCYFIPLLQLKDNDTKVEINCLQGHKSELPLKDYMVRGFYNSLDRVKCSICGLMREPKMIFKLCEECNIIMCKDCVKEHNLKNKRHHVITVRKMDIICCLHQLNFKFFCKKCNKNICDECLNNHRNNKHELICLSEINFNSKQIEEIREKIEEEKENLNDVIDVFNENMINLQNKFNDIIKEKKQTIKYKNNVFESYELKDVNYQVINNLKQLKFDNKPFIAEPNSDELTTIIKLFDYLTENNKAKNNKIAYNKNDIKTYSIVKEKELFINEQKKKSKLNSNSFSIIKEEELFINKKDDKKNKNKIKLVKNYNFMIGKKENKIKYKNKMVKNNNFMIGKKENKNKKDNYIIDNNTHFIIKIKDTINKITKNNKNKIDKNINFNIKNNKKNKAYNNRIIQNIRFNIEKSNIINPKDNNSKGKDSNNNENIVNDNNEIIYYNKYNLIRNDSNQFIKISEINNNSKRNSDREKYPDMGVASDLEKNKKLSQIKEETKIINSSYKKDENQEIKEYNYNNKNEELKMNMNNNFFELVNKINDIPSIENIEFSSSSFNIKIKSNNNLTKTNYQKKLNLVPSNLTKKKDENENDSNNNEQSLSIQFPKSPSFKEFNIDKKQIESFVGDQSEQFGFFFDEMNKKYKEENSDRNNKEKKNKNFEKKYKKNLFINKVKEKNNNLSNTYNKDKNNINKKDNNIITKNNKEQEKKLSKIKSSEKSKKKRKKKYFGKLVPKDDDDEDESYEANRTYDFGEENRDELKRISCLGDSKQDLQFENGKKDRNELNDIRVRLENNFSFDIENSNQISNLKKQFKEMNKKNIKNDNNRNENTIKNNFKIAKDTNTKNIQIENGKLKMKYNSYSQSHRSSAEKIKNKIYTNLKKNYNNKNISKNLKIEKNSNKNSVKNSHKKSPKVINSTQNSNNKNGGSKININIIKNEQTNIINDLIPKTKDKEKRKKKLIKANNQKYYNLSKSFDNTINKDIINRKKKLINVKNNLDLNQSFDASKNQLHTISVVRYFSSREKYNKIEIENGVSCIIEIEPEIFCIGDLIGRIKLYHLGSLNEILNINEHNGTINSLFLLNDKAILSTSADKRMKKISFKNNYKQYNVDFVFNGYNNYILKGIELKSNLKIISCSWDKKILIWEKDKSKSRNKKEYVNTDIYTEKDRILDLLEISKHEFISLSESVLKFWDSNTYEKLYFIKNEKKFGEVNSLCKINDEVISVNYYQYVQLINLNDKNIINSIKICDGDLSHMIKLKDDSILIAEEKNSENNNIFYVKQYEFIDGFLSYISFKRNKYLKNDKMVDKEIRALIQFSGGIIAQAICGENNGKVVGELVFYK